MQDSIRGLAVRGVVSLALISTLGAARSASAVNSFVLFESGQVRPLALISDGMGNTRLYAVNTPDNRLEIYSVTGSGLSKIGSVEVGMEPVAVAARTFNEVWVVNHLSDSVSIVDATATPKVVRTLLVGDEPRDIVFAGAGGNRAFITTARRGQNVPVTTPPLLTTEGVPRALVWVFDATNLGNTLEGDPLTIIELFGDTPRALAVNGSTVYAAVFHSGNQTTAVSEGAVCNDSNLNNNTPAGPCTVFGVTMPGGLPNPERSADNAPRPETGLIVKYNNSNGHWEDQLQPTPRNWNNAVKFDLPDYDVFKIDANGNPPAQIGPDTSQYAHVGTILFNMVANPAHNKVYVSNGDAHNEVRFEGPGGGGSTVRGHLHEARITVLDGSSVLPRHLNKHINYSVVPSPMGTADLSLATPVGMAVSSSGATLYVAGFGSQKIGIYDTTKLEADTFQTTPMLDGVTYVPLGAGGPTGVALDETNSRLYVLTRFDNAIRVVNTTTKSEETGLKQSLYNPEPASVTNGRRFLYDAAFTSSNGEASCSSCHIFGDFDSLAWDLGNPDDSVLNNPNPIRVPGPNPNFHPMKGPMTTQSLRGMANHGPMHWRGDRTAGNDPGGNALDEDGAFKKFNVAFNGLLGRSGPLTTTEMQAFTDFILQETYPPNPIRALDNQLVGDQIAGHNLYVGRVTDTVFNCNGCHVLNPAAGFFGSDGFTSFENEPQMFKIPHLRNAYQKVGMFGMPQVQFLTGGNNGPQGPQVRGFGFLHDGSVDTLFRFHGATVFSINTTERQQLEEFVLAYDSNMAPIVGQQVTLTNNNNAVPEVTARIALFDARMDAISSPECDVIVKGYVGGQERGWYRLPSGQFRSDHQLAPSPDPLLSAAQLRALAAVSGQYLTYTAVPVGSGERMGVDRDEDGFYDRDELNLGSDPADPLSVPMIPTATPTNTSPPTFTPTPTPTLPPATPASGKKVLIKNALPDDESKNKIVFLSKDSGIAIPAPGSAADPRCNASPSGTIKASLTVTSATSGESHTTGLPCQNWTLIGTITSPKGYKYSDPELNDGTAKTALWKSQNLKVTLLGKGPTALLYDLQPGVSQDPVGVHFSTLGNSFCMQCNGSSGKNGSDGRTFLGKDCSAPVVCPP
jgi:YVTN family beta-propeller protein